MKGPRSLTGRRRLGCMSRSALNVPDAGHQPQAGLPQCPWRANEVNVKSLETHISLPLAHALLVYVRDKLGVSRANSSRSGLFGSNRRRPGRGNRLEDLFCRDDGICIVRHVDLERCPHHLVRVIGHRIIYDSHIIS